MRRRMTRSTRTSPHILFAHCAVLLLTGRIEDIQQSDFLIDDALLSVRVLCSSVNSWHPAVLMTDRWLDHIYTPSVDHDQRIKAQQRTRQRTGISRSSTAGHRVLRTCDWINWIVKADFPTPVGEQHVQGRRVGLPGKIIRGETSPGRTDSPPPPTTTSLYSLKNWPWDELIIKT